MEHRFECKNCGQRMSATEDLLGTENQCPTCGHTFVIPLPSPPQIPSIITVPQPPPLPPRLPPTLQNPYKITASQPSKATNSHPLIAIGLFIVFFIAYPQIHNHGIRELLKSCQKHGVVGADVYYASRFSSDVIVFDLSGSSSSSARRIDTVHLLLEFASKLDFSTLDRLILANDGKQKFYVRGNDLKELASSYDAGGRIWSFNHLPERTCAMSGKRAFETWTGGLIAVSKQQADDLISLIDAWTAN